MSPAPLVTIPTVCVGCGRTLPRVLDGLTVLGHKVWREPGPTPGGSLGRQWAGRRCPDCIAIRAKLRRAERAGILGS